MKRKTFLASLLGMLALPFTVLSNKKETDKEEENYIIRESYVVQDSIIPETNEEYRIEIQDARARARILSKINSQIQSWETGGRGLDGKMERCRHFMIVIKPIKK